MNIILSISIGVGILISVFNFYLSFICKNKNKGSGIPMFGSLILLISLFTRPQIARLRKNSIFPVSIFTIIPFLPSKIQEKHNFKKIVQI